MKNFYLLFFCLLTSFIYSQTYESEYFVAEAIKANGSNTSYEIAFGRDELPINKLKLIKHKSTLILTEKEFIFENKYSKIKYEIISFKEGVYEVKNKEMIYKLIITKKSDKVKKYNYNYLITFIADEKMGGSTSYFFCNLKE